MCVAYSDPAAERRAVPGLLDDYAFTAVACLDAYEATADLSYFNFAQRIADKMVDLLFDPVSGGFFDTPTLPEGDQKADGSAGHAPKTISGFSHSCGKFRGCHRVAAAVRLHQPAELSREGGADAGSCWLGLPESLGSLPPPTGLQPCISRSRIPRSSSLAKTIWRSSSTPSPPVSSRSASRCSSWPRTRWSPQNLPPGLGGNNSSSARHQEGKISRGGLLGFTCQPPVLDPEQLRQSLDGALKRLKNQGIFQRTGNDADKKRGLTSAIRNSSALGDSRSR